MDNATIMPKADCGVAVVMFCDLIRYAETVIGMDKLGRAIMAGFDADCVIVANAGHRNFIRYNRFFSKMVHDFPGFSVIYNVLL
jgi:hypothetical protein